MADTSIHPSGCRCITCLAGYSEPAAPASLGERPDAPPKPREIENHCEEIRIKAALRERGDQLSLDAVDAIKRLRAMRDYFEKDRNERRANSDWLRAEVASLSSSLRETRAERDAITHVAATALCEIGAPDPRLSALRSATIMEIARRGASHADWPNPRALTLDEAKSVVAQFLAASKPAGATTRAEDATPE